MDLDAFRIRLAFMAAGLIALAIYVMAGGRLGPSNKGTVLIEYGAYPEAFEGLQIAIDGEPAGTLKSIGAQTRTAFAVKEGSHRITVVGAKFACQPREVDVKSGGTVMLLLEVAGSASAANPGKMPIVLN